MDKANDTNSQLDLSVKTEFSSVSYDVSKDKFFFVPHLQAPHFDDEKRASVDIICCIDRSGSMASNGKMELVKEVLNFVSRQLRSNDKLGLVLYDDVVSTALPLTTMDALGKQRAATAINAITTGSSTDLCAGMLGAIDMIEQQDVEKQNKVASILLLTDGLANAGISGTDEIVAELDKKIRPNTTHPWSIHTFGFGSDHEAKLLKAISAKSSGVYFFIQNKDQIADFFADCLGGLLSVVAQNIVLQVQPLEGVKISGIKTAFKVEPGADGSFSVFVGDLQSEEFRDIMVETSIPALPQKPAETQPIVHATLRYFNVITSRQEEVTLVGSLARSNPDEVPVPDIYVDQQKNRVIATEALTKAKERGDNRQYSEGRQLLQDAVTILSNSVSKDVEYVQGLIVDLNKATDGMKDQTSFTTYGGYSMTSHAVSHGQQRSCGTTVGYSTSSRFTMKSNYDDDDS